MEKYEAGEPHFLFIATPPFSGSTALAQVLATSSRVMLLDPRGEGQWLVPELHLEDRWNPDKHVDWARVRAVWLERIAELRAAGQTAAIVVEKSPPNLVRLDGFLRLFPNHTVVTFNRNPYANCASILYRNYEPGRMTAAERDEAVARLARDWVFRSTWIRKWTQELDAVDFTYEAFCGEPAACIERIAAILPTLGQVDVHREILVKDYPRQALSNHNHRQIALLRPNEVQVITAVLSSHRDLLRFFGYACL